MAFAQENIDELPFCDSDYEEVQNPADNNITDESGNGLIIQKVAAFFEQLDEPIIMKEIENESVV